jgi:uracil-DNA glycosylase family 4
VDPARAKMLEAIGVTLWTPREAALGANAEPSQAEPIVEPVAAPVPAPEVREPAPARVAAPAPAGDDATLGWAELRRRVAACVRCGLHATRTNTVFGVGDEAADWMFIGEAPGADEDAQGEPFVGRSGQLLTSMIAALGYTRQQVFIANILKCRPPENRDPLPEEVGHCLPYLARQVALVQPKIIVCVGRIAAQNLLGVDTPIGKLRGQVHRFRDSGIPVVVTYHPSYLLRSPSQKRVAWDDLKLARRTYEAGR